MCQLPERMKAYRQQPTPDEATDSSETDSPSSSSEQPNLVTTRPEPALPCPSDMSEISAHELVETLSPRNSNAIGLIHCLVTTVQKEMPEAAAAVTNFTIVHHHERSEHLPPSFGLVRLPNLRTLTLTGVVVSPKALLQFLRAHKSTLKTINLNCVALHVRSMRGMRKPQKVRCWTRVINYIRQKSQVEDLFLNSLTWEDGLSGKMSDTCVETPQAKYHWRYLEPERRNKFKLSNGALQAFGTEAVKDGIRMFVNAVEKCVQGEKATSAEI